MNSRTSQNIILKDVHDFIIHPLFDPILFHNDVGLIKLDAKVLPSNYIIHKITLPEQLPHKGILDNYSAHVVISPPAKGKGMHRLYGCLLLDIKT